MFQLGAEIFHYLQMTNILRQTCCHEFTGCHLCLTSDQQSTNKQCVVADVSHFINESLLGKKKSVINRGRRRVLTDLTSRKHCCHFNRSAVLGIVGVVRMNLWTVHVTQHLNNLHEELSHDINKADQITLHLLHLVKTSVQLSTSKTLADELIVSIF